MSEVEEGYGVVAGSISYNFFFPFSMLLVIFVQTDILISGSDGHWKLKFSFCNAKYCCGYLLIFNVVEF